MSFRKKLTLQELCEEQTNHLQSLRSKRRIDMMNQRRQQYEETFNKQFIDANALFAEKFNSVNAENQELLIENKNFI